MKPKTELEAIDMKESARLIELERKISNGVQTFIEVGDALAEIKERRLYRADFTNFADYCESKWGFTSMRARQLIEASEATHGLPQNVKRALHSARSAEAVAKLPKAKRVPAIKRAMKIAKRENREVAARDILPPKPKQAEGDESPLTLAQFQAAVDLLERRIPEDGDRMKYGSVLYKAGERQINWRKSKSAFNPYTS